LEIHHPHHHDHPQHKEKLWTHYALEFFMLFIAVSAGFFMENLREHFADQRRAKEYVRSFYEDLKTDTAKISALVNYDQQKIEGLSNLTNCYDSVSKNLKGTSCMFDLLKSSLSFRSFQMTDRTVRQLGNAGGFRLLEKEDADSIMKYESAFNFIQDFQSTLIQGAQDNVRNTFNQVINFKADAQMMNPRPGQELLFFNKEVTEPWLFSSDKALLNKYFNELLLYYKVIIAHQKRLRDLRENEMRLIEFFKNKYHLE